MADDLWTDTWTAEPTATHRVTTPLGLRTPDRADVLELVRGPGGPLCFELNRAEMILGRSDKVSCRVRSALVSRRHLRIQVQGPEVTVTDLDSRTPDRERTSQVINEMRARRVLISGAAKAVNVLKIRPPLAFDEADAARLLEALDQVAALHLR